MEAYIDHGPRGQSPPLIFYKNILVCIYIYVFILVILFYKITFYLP